MFISAPKLKGRPRKRKKIKRAGSPESESASSESSSVSASTVSKVRSFSLLIIQENKCKFLKSFQNGNSKNGLRIKDLLNILSQKNTKEELTFLKKLISFMEKRNTPIERPPMLGFKQSKLIINKERERERERQS